MGLVGAVHDKSEVATWLAQAHYSVEQGIRRIFRLLSTPDREASAAEPIKLLEVNADTVPAGIQPVYFGPVAEILYPSIIVEITPDEYEQLLKGSLQLPNGWQVGPELQRQ